MQQRDIYLFIFSFILFVIAAVMRYGSFQTMQSYTAAVDRTQEVITSLSKLENHFKSAQIYSPQYEGVARNYFSLYLQEAENIDNEIVELKELLDKDALQAKRMDSLANLINAHINVLFEKNIAELVESEEAWRLAYLFKISSTIILMIDYEERKLEERKKDLENSIEWNNILSTLFAIMAALIILVAFWRALFLSKKGRWLEGFLESILNTSQYGIISLSAIRSKGDIVDFKVEYANKAAMELFNFQSDTIGKKLSNLPIYFQSGSFEKFSEVVETEKLMHYEEVFEREDLIKWFSIRLAPREDGLTASFLDITTLKVSEQELKNSIQQLAKSNAELEQYAYVASHDLQEPLRKIQLFGNMLWEQEAEKLDKRGKMQLEKIQKSAERMSRLIRDILTFSSLRKESLFEKADLNQALQHVLQDLDLLITQKQATVKLEQLPVIEAIPLQMRQLFYNLINNALKFTSPNRKPEIIITCRQLTENDVREYKNLDADEEYFEVTVEDNGIGFTNEQAEHIFGLFKRLHAKDAYAGSGIGLSLCLRVVENHHGIIYASGEVDKGAKFYIIIPRNQPRVYEDVS